MNDSWKDIPGYEGYYQASKNGSIRSIDRTILRAGIRVRIKGVVLKSSVGENDYPTVVLSKNGQYKTWYVHDLVAITFIGPKPIGHVVRHITNVKTNCKLSNLEYGTIAENADDRNKSGTAPIGEKNGRAKLTVSEVATIRSMIIVGKKAREIAAQFKVSEGTISNIKHNKNW